MQIVAYLPSSIPSQCAVVVKSGDKMGIASGRDRFAKIHYTRYTKSYLTSVVTKHDFHMMPEPLEVKTLEGILVTKGGVSVGADNRPAKE